MSMQSVWQGFSSLFLQSTGCQMLIFCFKDRLLCQRSIIRPLTAAIQHALGFPMPLFVYACLTLFLL